MLLEAHKYSGVGGCSGAILCCLNGTGIFSYMNG